MGDEEIMFNASKELSKICQSHINDDTCLIDENLGLIKFYHAQSYKLMMSFKIVGRILEFVYINMFDYENEIIYRNSSISLFNRLYLPLLKDEYTIVDKNTAIYNDLQLTIQYDDNGNIIGINNNVDKLM